MFTECPECGIAFRVTAKVLQQAHGNVRCGGCNHAFNALEYLSEEMPGLSVAEVQDPPVDELTETSRRLLKTLDELAGSEDIRIEDTGVEWRVLENTDDDVVAEDSGDQVEQRYDDNSPLPDEVADSEGLEDAPDPPAHQDAAGNVNIEFNEVHGDLALSKPEEWTDLLDEFHDPDSEAHTAEDNIDLDGDPSSNRDASSDGNIDIADLDSQFHSQAEALGLDLSTNEKALTDEVPYLDNDETRFVASADEKTNDADPSEFSDDESGNDTRLENDSVDEEIAAAIDDDLEDACDEIAASIESDGGMEFDELIEADDALSLADDESERDGNSSPQRESTGEFEAQIEAAATAFSDGWDDEMLDEEGESCSPAETELAGNSTDTAYINNDILPAGSADAIDDLIAAAADEFGFEDKISEDAPPENKNTSEPKHYVAPLSDEELTINKEIDQEMMALATQDDDFSATLVGMKTPKFMFAKNSDDVESIIMEGDSVRTAAEQERLAARNRLDDADSLSGTFALSRDKVSHDRRRFDPPNNLYLAAIASLCLAFGLQFIHNSRETLATSGLFGMTIAPIYRLVGAPITPQWNIRGWQFEKTNGRIDEAEAALVVVSQLVNRATESLPYPLVHVSLTDRWENIMGSRILEPGEYLAGALDASVPVQPGDKFTAVISIENPAVEATGFKLNVCYRAGPETVRCAIETFKN